MKALVDTSFLMICAERGRNYLSLLEKKVGEVIQPVVLDSVLDEVKRISSGRGKRAMLARVAAQYVAGAEIVQAGGPADEALVKYSAEHMIPVVSVDSRLLRRLASAGLPYMTVSRAGKPIVRLILR
ncbi:MAG: hypothetical protein QXS57_03905 [Candidatus Caldarchaeum sp.]|uniref:VapC9 PIN-like domain-containing protein n=1 Tax=Caldiarchaeum subterraneum TaxID=311458 RepID=A0A7J3VS57_CALS0